MRSRRAFWVVAHRWIGLTTALLLIIVGVTGSLLAYYGELDRALNPELLTVTPRGAMIDPFTLRDRVAALEPHGDVDVIDLEPVPDKAYQLLVTPHEDPSTGRPYDLGYDVMFVDPYSGARLGERRWGEASMARKNLMPFVYKVHYALGLPAPLFMFGIYLLGVVALAWTVDCFVALYLTLPSGRRGASSRRSYLQRLRPAWWPKWRAGPFRLWYDLHRAAGLWAWAMLFVLAWSSVALNFTEVYEPVTRALLGPITPAEVAPRRSSGAVLAWRDAYARGRELMAEAARRHDFHVLRESALSLDRDVGVYRYVVHGTADTHANGYTATTFDAKTGEFVRLEWAGSQTASDVVTSWLIALHTARVFGAPMHAFVCAMGLVIAMLAASGVYVWWVKRRRRARMRGVVA